MVDRELGLPNDLASILLVPAMLGTFLLGTGWAWEVAGDVSVVEEVVVSARKREEPSRSTPIAMTVLSEFDLDDQSVQDLADVSFHAPNVQIKPYPAVNADANISMRGQSQFEPVITMDPPVALYVDDVYLGRSTASLLNLIDLERVEVLMGPQGTLYGRNTTGGLVHLITKRYGGEGFGGYLELLGGNRGRRNLSGAVSLPLIDDDVGVRLAFRSTAFNGHNRNIFLDEKLDDEDVQMFRANLGARLTDTWNLQLSYDKTKQRERSTMFRLDYIEPTVLRPNCVLEPQPELGCLINVLITGDNWRTALEPGNREIRSDVSSRHDIDVWGTAATLKGTVAALGIRSITAYRALRRRNINDIDGTQWEILHPDADAEQRQFSKELRLSAESLNGIVKWSAGAFYFAEAGEDKTTVVGVPGLNPLSPSTIVPKGRNRSIAGYVHLIYALTPDTILDAGFRYTYEQRRLSTAQENGGGCTLRFVNRPPCRTKVSATFGGWSYRASVDHHFRDNRMAFASFSRGFKSGGFNARASDKAEFKPFDPETVDSFDLGIKSRWLNQKVRLNVSTFYARYRNIQRTQLIPLSDTEIGTTIANAAVANIHGAEVTAAAQLTARLSLRATAGLTIADYRDFTEFNEAGELIDKSDLMFPNTPRYAFSRLARYSFPIALGGSTAEFAVQADYSWQSRTFNDIENSDIDQPAYGLLNFRASMHFYATDIEVAFFALNVTDETYVTGGLDLTDQFGYRGTFLGRARSTNLQVIWRFP